jgi:hypothetical protein
MGRTLTIEQASRRDLVCCYWVDSPPTWCVLTGRTTSYQYGEETVPAAIVLFVSDAAETAAVELEHLTPVAHMPGFMAQLEMGEVTAWTAGRQSKEQEEGGYWE